MQGDEKNWNQIWTIEPQLEAEEQLPFLTETLTVSVWVNHIDVKTKIFVFYLCPFFCVCQVTKSVKGDDGVKIVSPGWVVGSILAFPLL